MVARFVERDGCCVFRTGGRITSRLPLLRIIIAIAVLVAVPIGYMGWRWVRPPRRLPPDGINKADAQDVYLTSLDGTRLHAVYLEGKPEYATIILCHGYFQSLSEPWQVGIDLNKDGYNIFLLDFRASGSSGGRFTTVGYKESWDILAASRFVSEHYGRGPIGVFGISMGAASAIIAAARSEEIAAVVADSSFSNLEAVMRWKIPDFMPFYRLSFLAWLCIGIGQLLSGLRLRKVCPLEHVAAISPRPLLLIYGEDDSYIPQGQGQELYNRAGQPKKLWIGHGSDHAQARKDYPQEYIDLVKGWFDQYLMGSSGTS